MTLEQIHRQTATVEGFLTPNEGEVLYMLARQCSGRGGDRWASGTRGGPPDLGVK